MVSDLRYQISNDCKSTAKPDLKSTAKTDPKADQPTNPQADQSTAKTDLTCIYLYFFFGLGRCLVLASHISR